MLSFRVDDLPQEIRNLIYEYVLDPKVILRHIYLCDRIPVYHLPNLDPHPGMQIC
jgi:hypothetical protein